MAIHKIYDSEYVKYAHIWFVKCCTSSIHCPKVLPPISDKNKIVKNSSKNSNFDDSGIPLPGSLLELIQNCICNPLDGWKVHNEP